MHIDDFDYPLDDSRIAQIPIEPRDHSLLLDALSPQKPLIKQVKALADIVSEGDLIVLNNTRVLPARLHLNKPTGAAVEVFLLNPAEQTGYWQALVRPSRRVPENSTLEFNGEAVIEVAHSNIPGTRLVKSLTGESLIELAHRIGQVPLPPYISTKLQTSERYQTVYSEAERSVAAPTAGLHFTPELLQKCKDKGARIKTVELAVGLGTFKPITVSDVGEHQMHTEAYHVPGDVLQAAKEAKRVIAIGTTTVRALESAALFGPGEGTTDLFITPGFSWQIVDVLLTNFHMPKSSLLVMISAFVGPVWKQLYSYALDNEFRFLSFGDAMIIQRES